MTSTKRASASLGAAGGLKSAEFRIPFAQWSIEFAGLMRPLVWQSLKDGKLSLPDKPRDC